MATAHRHGRTIPSQNSATGGRALARIARLVAFNEALAIAGHARAEEARRQAFVCECGTLSCRGLVRLPLSEYERVRRRNALVLLVGHELQP
jgi:hypothetical protein